MVCRSGLAGVLLIIIIFCIGGCGEKDLTEVKSAGEEVENMDEMKHTERIMELLDCGQPTAVSIEQIWTDAGVDKVSEVKKVSDRGYRVLQLSTDSEETYFVFVGIYNSVEKIRKDAVDGELIFGAIE